MSRPYPGDVVSDPYTLLLLAVAIEEAPNHAVNIWRDEDGFWRVESDVPALASGGTTLAGALTVLLRDVLNVEVPERPVADPRPCTCTKGCYLATATTSWRDCPVHGEAA